MWDADKEPNGFSILSPLNWISTSSHGQKPWTSSDPSLRAWVLRTDLAAWREGRKGRGERTKTDHVATTLSLSHRPDASLLLLWGRAKRIKLLGEKTILWVNIDSYNKTMWPLYLYIERKENSNLWWRTERNQNCFLFVFCLFFSLKSRLRWLIS